MDVSLQAMEALLATEEGNFVLGDDLGTGLIDNLVGEWRLLYTSSNAMEYNQVTAVDDTATAVVPNENEYGSHTLAAVAALRRASSAQGETNRYRISRLEKKKGPRLDLRGSRR